MPKSLSAQVNDFAVWENISLEKLLSNKTSINLNQKVRVTENASEFRYACVDFGLTHKFNKHWSASIDYVLVEKMQNVEFWSSRHRLYFDVVYKKKIRFLHFYWHPMIQSQVQDVYSSETGKIPEYVLRNKITLKYDIHRYTPYIAGELNYKAFSPLRQADRARYFVGCFYDLDEFNQLEMYYLLEKHFNINKASTNYVLGVGFSHTFY